jgi:YfiH family protein
VFTFQHTVEGVASRIRVAVAFTDSTLDLQGPKPGFADALARTVEECGVAFARLHQVHGAEVLVVADDDLPAPDEEAPVGDALVTTRHGVGLMVRVADCVPVVLADPDAGVVGAVHAGRPGMALDVVTRAVERMRAEGATAVVAWVGPHVCGHCYEVPEQMRAEVAESVPEAWSVTSWGTPALDIGAGVRAQLERAGVVVHEVGGCTLEDERLHSFRRDGVTAGRMAGLVWMS